MLNAADIPFTSKRGDEGGKFRHLGDQRYAFTLPGLSLELDRLRRSSHELWGELTVRVNGRFPNARTFDDGILQVGDLNLSSVQARTTRGKLLAERAGEKDTDWAGLLEEFTTRVIAAERSGHPSIGLAEAPLEEESDPVQYTVEGWPLLADLPVILFGDPASTKSQLAVWAAGTLALRGIPVLYLDWELSGSRHRKRVERLFQPPPNASQFRYLRCENPLIRIIDGILAEIRRWKIRYVVCDSIGWGVEGSPMDPEAATRYFNAVRRFNCGSLHLAHIAKNQEEGKDPTIFGSNFFRAGARSAWYVEKATDNPDHEIRIGLFQRKNLDGPEQRTPLGYRLVFGHHRTQVLPVALESIDELAVRLPMVDRIRAALASGPVSVKRLAEDLGSQPNIVRAVLAKHKSQFVRLGDKVNLKQPGMDF